MLDIDLEERRRERKDVDLERMRKDKETEDKKRLEEKTLIIVFFVYFKFLFNMIGLI